MEFAKTPKNTSVTIGDDDLIRHLYYLPQGIKRLEQLGETVKIDKDRVLNVVNEVPDYCYLVKSGRVICYEITLGGVQRIYSFMEPDSIFLEECLLLDKPSPVFFKTLVTSTLVRISKCALKHAFKHDIDLVVFQRPGEAALIHRHVTGCHRCTIRRGNHILQTYVGRPGSLVPTESLHRHPRAAYHFQRRQADLMDPRGLLCRQGDSALNTFPHNAQPQAFRQVFGFRSDHVISTQYQRR